MAKTTCILEFYENPFRIYYGGQVMNGRAILTLHKPKTVRGIYVQIEGKAHCQWKTGSGKSEQTHTGDELYFSEKTFFVGGEAGDVEVQPGIYTYTFQCNLPYALPTSLEAEYGHIRYTVMVNLDRPFWPDQEFISAFTVIKPLNLNALPGLDRPTSNFNEITFNECCCWCCCFTTDPVTITGHIPKTGYTPGEAIYINTTIDNKSMDIRQFSAQIVKIIDYHTHRDSSRTKREEMIVTEKILRGVACNRVQTFDCSIEVPPIPPTDTDSSDICKVTYVVRIHGDADVCSEAQPKLDMPIIIGTNPLNIVGVMPAQVLQPAPPITDQPAPMSDRVDRPTISAENPSAPLLSEDPPTYEEAVGIEANINGNAYKPRYLVYRRTNSTASYNN